MAVHQRWDATRLDLRREACQIFWEFKGSGYCTSSPARRFAYIIATSYKNGSKYLVLNTRAVFKVQKCPAFDIMTRARPCRMFDSILPVSYNHDYLSFFSSFLTELVPFFWDPRFRFATPFRGGNGDGRTPFTEHALVGQWSLGLPDRPGT